MGLNLALSYLIIIGNSTSASSPLTYITWNGTTVLANRLNLALIGLTTYPTRLNSPTTYLCMPIPALTPGLT